MSFFYDEITNLEKHPYTLHEICKDSSTDSMGYMGINPNKEKEFKTFIVPMIEKFPDKINALDKEGKTPLDYLFLQNPINYRLIKKFRGLGFIAQDKVVIPHLIEQSLIDKVSGLDYPELLRRYLTEIRTDPKHLEETIRRRKQKWGLTKTSSTLSLRRGLNNPNSRTMTKSKTGINLLGKTQYKKKPVADNIHLYLGTALEKQAPLKIVELLFKQVFADKPNTLHHGLLLLKAANYPIPQKPKSNDHPQGLVDINLQKNKYSHPIIQLLESSKKTQKAWIGETNDKDKNFLHLFYENQKNLEKKKFYKVLDCILKRIPLETQKNLMGMHDKDKNTPLDSLLIRQEKSNPSVSILNDHILHLLSKFYPASSKRVLSFYLNLYASTPKEALSQIKQYFTRRNMAPPSFVEILDALKNNVIPNKTKRLKSLAQECLSNYSFRFIDQPTIIEICKHFLKDEIAESIIPYILGPDSILTAYRKKEDIGAIINLAKKLDFNFQCEEGKELMASIIEKNDIKSLKYLISHQNEVKNLYFTSGMIGKIIQHLQSITQSKESSRTELSESLLETVKKGLKIFNSISQSNNIRHNDQMTVLSQLSQEDKKQTYRSILNLYHRLSSSNSDSDYSKKIKGKTSNQFNLALRIVETNDSKTDIPVKKILDKKQQKQALKSIKRSGFLWFSYKRFIKTLQNFTPEAIVSLLENASAKDQKKVYDILTHHKTDRLLKTLDQLLTTEKRQIAIQLKQTIQTAKAALLNSYSQIEKPKKEKRFFTRAISPLFRDKKEPDNEKMQKKLLQKITQLFTPSSV